MRKIAGVIFATAMVLPLGLVATPAGAAPASSCTKLTGTATWTPKVDYVHSVTHKVTSSSTLSGCTGTKGITSGKASFTSPGKVKENCAQLLASKTGSTASSTIKWNNGKTSILAKLTLKWVAVATYKITGKVTGGTQKSFIGKNTSLTTTFVPKNKGCLDGHTPLTTATTALKKGTKATLG